MTISATTRRAGPYLGNGAATSFAFAFKVFAAADVSVAIADSSGIETVLVQNSDYSVSLNANQDTSPGGTITYPITGSALPVGSRLVIVGDLDLDQPLDIPAGGNFSPTAIESEFDRIVMQVQQVQESTSRALHVPVSSGVDTELPTPAANQVIAWDATGTALENISLSNLSTTAAYGQYTADTFTADGTTTQFTLTGDPGSVGNLQVSVDGLMQVPSSDYSIVSGKLVFLSAPTAGAQILARYGEALPSLYEPSASVTTFGAVGDGTTDDTAAFNAAIAAAATAGTEFIIVPAGTFRVGSLNLTDKKITLLGAGIKATTLKYNGSAGADMLTFGTTSTAATKVTGCGVRDMTIDCNQTARYGLRFTSVFNAVVQSVDILSPATWGIYMDCIDRGALGVWVADNQRCRVQDVYIECITPSSAGGIFLTGNGGATAVTGANTSLNHFENIRFNIRNGDAFYLQNADGNTAESLFVFKPSTGGLTGRGVVFGADDTGNSNHARNNVMINVQSARGGVYALAGNGTQPSTDNFVVFNNGNNGVNFPPTIETGAALGFITDRMSAGVASAGAVMVPRNNFVTSAANAAAQIPLVVNESLRVYNGASAHSKWVDSNDNEWSLNVENATGNFRFTRVVGTGLVYVGTGMVASTVQTQVSSYAANATLSATSASVVLVDATAASRTITLPLAADYSTSRTAVLHIRRIDSSANTVTIQRQSTNTLNGGTSETLNANSGKTYVSDQTSAWYSF